MRPIEWAASVYDREPCARTFTEDLEAHLLHGYVFSSPKYFWMGRPVYVAALESEIVNPWHNTWDKEPDCWHYYLYSGSIAHAVQLTPYKLPWLSFERNNILRLYRSDVIWEKCLTLFPLS